MIDVLQASARVTRFLNLLSASRAGNIDTIIMQLPDSSAWAQLTARDLAALTSFVNALPTPAIPMNAPSPPVLSEIKPKRTHNMSPENRARAAERMKEYWRKKKEQQA